jgi:hypothetical protein
LAALLRRQIRAAPSALEVVGSRLEVLYCSLKFDLAGWDVTLRGHHGTLRSRKVGDSGTQHGHLLGTLGGVRCLDEVAAHPQPAQRRGQEQRDQKG